MLHSFLTILYTETLPCSCARACAMCVGVYVVSMDDRGGGWYNVDELLLLGFQNLSTLDDTYKFPSEHIVVACSVGAHLG